MQYYRQSLVSVEFAEALLSHSHCTSLFNRMRVWEAVMIRTVTLICLLFAVLITSAQARDFDHGKTAYNRGDYARAFEIFSNLAEDGHPIAQANLSILYFRGVGAPMDYALAVEWARRAAEHGYAVAQAQLGYLYLNVSGKMKDDVKAVKWYRRAAEQGFDVAQATLGTLYYQGIGVSRDHVEAVKWFRLAAAQCNADANAKLGVAYFRGEGVSKDLTQAYVWFYIAQESGNQSVTKILDFLVTQMTSAQILKAQRMAQVRQESNTGVASVKSRDSIEQDFIIGRELYPDRYR